MNPTEKLLADLDYWRNEQRDAEERLRVANAVLPGLEHSLERLSKDQPSLVQRAERQREEQEPDGAPSPPPAKAEAAPAPVVPETPRLTGTAEEQVFQALQIKAPQSSEDLEEFLAAHGRAFSRGAVNFAIRDLRKAGKIVEVEKRGNLRYYKPAPPPAETEA